MSEHARTAFIVELDIAPGNTSAEIITEMARVLSRAGWHGVTVRPAADGDAAARTAPTVTVTCRRRYFTLSFSRLPGQSFGPYDFPEAAGQLRIAALLEPHEARNLVMAAATSADRMAITETRE
jgi:hypothetical protein